ncbi:MAG: ferrous iron transport protein A [Firmicutes bacterium]|nr:ferrous iron transport protein A [Bacillota bacterium]
MTGQLDSVQLATLSPRQRAIIMSLPADDALVRRLTAYGLIPGVEVMVERRVPAFIVIIGATRIALDWQIAAGIVVQVSKP